MSGSAVAIAVYFAGMAAVAFLVLRVWQSPRGQKALKWYALIFSVILVIALAYRLTH